MTDLLNFINFFNKKIIIIILILFPLSAHSKEITLPDGSKYRGEIKNGQAHGKGTSTNQNFINQSFQLFKYITLSQSFNIKSECVAINIKEVFFKEIRRFNNSF